MLEGLAPDLGPRLLIAIGGVAAAFLVLIAVLVFLKRRNSPLFIKGGRAREHRLLVLDAAAVDAKRRLVLIRRDDTEHLIMIGGPTDIVIETGIGGASRDKAVAQPAVVPDRSVTVEATRLDQRRRQDAEAAQAARSARPAERPAPQPAVANRPAADAVKPAVAGGVVSAMGSVLYDEDREPLAGAQALEAGPTRRPAGSEPASIATQAEDVLDQARNRVLAGAPAQEPAASASDDVVKALEARLDASRAEAEAAAKAEAARVEAQRQEALRAEAARAEAARLEARRAEAAKTEAARIEAETRHAEAEKAEAERIEAARVEAERVAAARSEAMARYEAARRMQAEQRQVAQVYGQQSSSDGPPELPGFPVQTPPAKSGDKPEEQTGKQQERLVSDFEKLLEAELEADGVLDGDVPQVSGERRDPAFSAPSVNPEQRGNQPITGATPGKSIEQDMARRLGEITLNKQTDAL